VTPKERRQAIGLGGAALVAFGAYMYFSGQGKPAATTTAPPIRSIGQPPASEYLMWMRSTGGWYPMPKNLPPGWVPGQSAPQPTNATAPHFQWTGAGWVPNPSNPPAGWTL
jgi:hypothetical protein